VVLTTERNRLTTYGNIRYDRGVESDRTADRELRRELTRGMLVAAVAVVLALVGGCLAKQEASSSTPEAAVTAVGAVTKPAAVPQKLHLVAVGDIMLDRSVGDRIAANGCASIIEEVADHLCQGDIVFGNLECPLSTVGPHQPRGACIFRADPKTVKVLALGGFDIVSLANNHALNSGRAALLQTLDHLEQAGIAYVGAARIKARGSDPTFITVGDIRVGFLAYTDLSFNCGSYSKVDENLSRLRQQIKQARNNCNLLIVSYHWGEEYRRKPTSRQVKVAHVSIEAGADVVLGHHPHVLEGIELYQNRPIIYSMGSFIFDQRSGERMESGIFDLYYVQGRGWRVEMTPVWIPWSRLGAEHATRQKRDRIAQRIQELSAQLGTVVEVIDGIVCVDYPTDSSQTAGRTGSSVKSN